MPFHDRTLPLNYSYTSTRDFSTAVTQFKADSKDVMAYPQQQVKFQYQLQFSVRTFDDAALLRSFHFCHGKLYPFRFHDGQDCTTASDGFSATTMTDQPITLINGKYYLTKTYGGQNRVIKLPEVGTISVSDGGVLVSGVSINPLTGEVTGHTPSGAYKWGGRFDVPTRFASPLSQTYNDYDGISIAAALVEVTEDLS